MLIRFFWEALFRAHGGVNAPHAPSNLRGGVSYYMHAVGKAGSRRRNSQPMGRFGPAHGTSIRVTLLVMSQGLGHFAPPIFDKDNPDNLSCRMERKVGSSHSILHSYTYPTLILH